MLVLLLASFLLVPPVLGTPGPTPGEAPLMTPGTYPDEELTDIDSYYNVSGKVGANLTVVVTCAIATGLEISLYAPNGTEIATDAAMLYLSVSIICDSSDQYCINIRISAGCRVTKIPIVLVIALLGGGGIPAFGLLVAFFSVLTLLGLIIFQKSRQKYALMHL